jgi:hypothetical protein
MDCDYSLWAERKLKDVAATEPEAIGAWLSDFAAAPHGGKRSATFSSGFWHRSMTFCTVMAK